jgi:3-hydroxyisobutyrate dehydrogenase/2-hydroxy-3-oxopropionate reductase
MTAVAVVGTGRMGAAMAGRLAAAGHEVTVWNRDSSRASALGLPVARTAKAAAQQADVVVVSLADDAALDAVYRGEDGLVAGLAPDTVVVETSTVDPDTVRALEPLVAGAGAALLDAPVSGSVPVVERGQLTVMAGGDPAALDRVRPVLGTFASHVFHLGPVGAGATMKLVVNAVVAELCAAVSEALVLAEKAGIAREAAYEVFTASAVAAPFVHYKRAAFEHPATAPIGFTLDLVAKDQALIAALAARVGARLDQFGAGRDLVAAAIAAGYGARDMAALASYLRDAP